MSIYDPYTAEERLLRIYQDIGAVVPGHFFLTSGRHSNIFINKDKIYSHPLAFKETVEALLGHVEIFEYDIVTGPAIAGAVLAAPVALAVDKIFAYPEKVPEYFDSNGHPTTVIGLAKSVKYKMTFRRGYDKVIPGKRVLIVEDVATTGGSIQKTINAVIELGGFVEGVLVGWNCQGWKPQGPDIISVINQRVESWKTLVHGEYYQEGEHCPLCQEMVPLQDPKSL